MVKILKKIQSTLKNRKTYKAGLLQAKVYRVLKGFTLDKLAAYNLSTVDWALLGLLHDSGEGMRPGVLAEELGVEPPFVTVIIAKLTKMELINVKMDKKDNRVKIFFLSLKGERMIPEIEVHLRKEMGVLVKGIEYGDLMSYLSVLEQIVGNSKGLKFKKFTGFKD